MVSDWFWPCFVVCRPPFFPLKRASPRGSGLESLSLVRRPLAYYVSWDARTLKAVLPSGPCRHVDMRIMFGHGNIWILRYGWLDFYLAYLENSFAWLRFRSRMSTFTLSLSCYYIRITYSCTYFKNGIKKLKHYIIWQHWQKAAPTTSSNLPHSEEDIREGPNHHPLLSVISVSGSGSLF